MAQLAGHYATGITVVAVIRSDSRLFADVVTVGPSAPVMESFNVLNIANYSNDCTEEDETGEYYFTWPSGLDVGLYSVRWIPVAGSPIVVTDYLNLFAAQSYYWDGTNLIPDWAFKIAGVASPVADSGEARVKAITVILTGITSLASWLGISMGKTADAGTLAEVNATTGGTSYDNTTEAQEALRDRGDAAWTTAVIGSFTSSVSGGEVTESKVTVYQDTAIKAPTGDPLTWEIVANDGTPIDLSGKALIINAYKPDSDTVLWFYTTSTGLSIGGVSNNIVSLTADDTNTADAGVFRYQIDNTDDDVPIARGPWIVVGKANVD